MQNIKIKIIFVLLFLLIYSILLSLNIQDKNTTTEKELFNFSKKLESSFNGVVNENSIEAQTTSSIIREENILIPTMLNAAYEAKEVQEKFKDKLYKRLKPLYEMILTEGVSNISFVLPNNKCFLRMNSPNSTHEKIFKEKYIYKIVDSTHKETSGLERSSHGLHYSYVFPIMNEENIYLGSYSISYSIDYIQKFMNHVDGMQTEYLPYTQKYHNTHWKEKEAYINKNIAQGLLFSTYIRKDSQLYVASFFPLISNNEKSKIDYLITYSTSNYLEKEIQRFYNKNAISFITLFIILSLLYWLTIHQNNIKEEKERFQLAIDSSNDGLWDWNIAKGKTYFSPRFKEMLGFNEDELKENFNELVDKIHKDDKEIFKHEIQNLLDSHSGVFKCEYRMMHKNGQWIWILGRAKATFDNSYKALRAVGFHSDITLKKKYESQQARLIQELKDVATSKSDFLANMSHEIRTPMNAILGFIQILIKQENDPKKIQKFNIINDSGNSLLRIINDILDFSKIESNKLLIENIPYNLPDTFKHIQELYRAKAKENKITITLNIDNNLPQQILGDKIRVKQVVSNLLSNAIKFSNENSVITINVLREENFFRCEVIDTGTGISQKKLDDIFNSFTQEDSSTTRKFGGTGLGLSISKALCELMDGEIGVQSTLGEGSTFYFSLPISEVIEPEEITTQQTSKNNIQDIRGRILIAEDNKTNQLLLIMLLDEYDIECIIANDGLQAVEMVKKEHFDLILMDENMPNMNGIEATKIIKSLQDKKEIPIVAVTANAINGDRERFLNAGMDDYISKPVDSNKLDEVLYKYLHIKKTQ